MVKLSFLIPVYKVEKYIARCIDSILSQKYANIEILLGIDGSPDRSAEVCIAYAQQYDFIYVFNNKNMGAGAERNFLLDRAKGDFVWFVDADDMLPEGAVEKVIEVIEKKPSLEIIAMGFKRFGDLDNYGSLEFATPKEKMISGKEYLLKQPFCGYLWNKVFNRMFLFEHGVKMNPNLVNQEDNLFNLYAILPCEKMLLTSIYGYDYFQGNTLSTLHNRSIESVERNVNDTLLAQKEIQEIIRSISDVELKKRIIELLNLNVAGFLFSMFQTRYPIEKIKIALEQLKRMQLYPPRFSFNRKSNIFLCGANIEWIYLCLCRLHGAKRL